MGFWKWDNDKNRPEYVPSMDEIFGDYVAGFFDGAADFMRPLFLIIMVVSVLVYTIPYFGGAILSMLGIIKSDVQVSSTLPENSSIAVEDVDAVLVSFSKKPKVYKSDFSEDGNVAFEMAGIDHFLYAAYDGMMYDYGYPVIPDFLLNSPISVECTLEPSRAVLITFKNSDNQQIIPENFAITDNHGTHIGYAAVNSGVYALILPDNASDISLTFSVPGYDPFTIEQDWNLQRLGKLEVTLYAP